MSEYMKHQEVKQTFFQQKEHYSNDFYYFCNLLCDNH